MYDLHVNDCKAGTVKVLTPHCKKTVRSQSPALEMISLIKVSKSNFRNVVKVFNVKLPKTETSQLNLKNTSLKIKTITMKIENDIIGLFIIFHLDS